MSKKSKRIIKNSLLILGSSLVMLLAFIFIWNINRFGGYTGDDFLYHFVYTGEWPKGVPQPYHNLLDWIEAVHTHMTQWNARFTSIIFEIGAMQFHKTTFNIINAIAFIIVGLEANILASGKKFYKRPLQLLSTYVLMWFFLAGFGSTIMWVSGAANYLWPAVLILGFFIPYRFDFKIKKHDRLMTWAIFLLAILVGMANEVGSSTAIIVVGLFTYFNRPSYSFENSWWKFVGVVANAGAFIYMILKSSNSTEVQNYGEKDGLLYHIGQILGNTMTYSGALLLLNIVLGLYIIFSQRNFFGRIFSKNQLTQKEYTTLSGMIFLIGGFSGVAATVISPILFPRLWFAINILWIISLLNFFEVYQMDANRRIISYVSLVIGTAALIYLVIPSYYIHLENVKESYDVFYTHEQLVNQARQKHQSIVKAPGLPINSDLYNPYTGTPYIMPGNAKKQWSNVWMASYWKVDEIQLDNTVPVQHSPQKDLSLVSYVDRYYQKHLKHYQKHAIPGITVPENNIVSVKNAGRDDSFKLKYDNSNLSKNKPWLRNAWIKYIDVNTNQVVGTERITSPYNNVYNISNASLPGYQTLTNNSKTYTFNKGWHQTIDLKVKSQSNNINIYFNQIGQDGKRQKKTLISTEHIKAVPGQIITVKVPEGYTFVNGDIERRLNVNGQTGEVNYNIKRMPFKQWLKHATGIGLLWWALILWLLINISFDLFNHKIKNKD